MFLSLKSTTLGQIFSESCIIISFITWLVMSNVLGFPRGKQTQQEAIIFQEFGGGGGA